MKLFENARLIWIISYNMNMRKVCPPPPNEQVPYAYARESA